MTLALEDAILRLKAEIIAQDWRLSPNRAEQLETAFASLRQHFARRKPIHAMLVMATNVLNYIKNRGASPPETIDFLKEAMAHIVNLHEDLADDPTREERLFHGLFSRFTTLKTKIQLKAGPVVSLPAVQPGQPESPARPQPQPSRPDFAASASEQDLILLQCQAFTNAMINAGSLGAQIASLFSAWLESPAVSSLLHGRQVPPLDGGPPCLQPVNAIIACPPTPVRVLTMGGTLIAIQSNAIAMLRPITPSMASLYLQNATVPLKDFAKFLQKLAHQFNGSLALVDEKTLMGLNLPVMIPQGHDLPETPSSSSSILVLLSSGNRHGAIVCEAALDTAQIMTQFTKQHNGDIAGNAYMEDGGTFPLLDPFTILQREGILLIRD